MKNNIRHCRGEAAIESRYPSESWGPGMVYFILDPSFRWDDGLFSDDGLFLDDGLLLDDGLFLTCLSSYYE